MPLVARAGRPVAEPSGGGKHGRPVAEPSGGGEHTAIGWGRAHEKAPPGVGTEGPSACRPEPAILSEPQELRIIGRDPRGETGIPRGSVTAGSVELLLLGGALQGGGGGVGVDG